MLYSKKKFRMSSNSFKNLAIAFGVAGLGLMPLMPVTADTVFLKGTAYQSGISTKEVIVGSSEVIVSNAPIRRVAIADPSIADIKILSETTALVRGKKAGKTTLLIWEGKDSSARPYRFDLTAKRDISDLVASLKLLDPNINVDYIIVPALQLPASKAVNSNGAYTTSYKTSPETVGDPAPSVVVSNQPPADAAAPLTAAASQQGGTGEKIILSGKVKSADVIAKAVSTAALYMGEDPNVKIITRNGGLIVDQVSQILSEQDATQGGGGTGSQALTSPVKFTSNLKGNIGGGAIVSNLTGNILSFLEVSERPQVSVLIRFYEVSRSIGKEFSSRIAFLPKNGQIYGLGVGGKLPDIGLTTQTNPLTGAQENIFNFAEAAKVGGATTSTIFALFPKPNLSIVLRALESRGEVKALAEPNIVVTSGEPGKFFAGGEVPVRQAISTLGAIGQQVTFESFGISLNILPTVLDNDSILMNVNAQTRDLDTANPFNQGSNVPAFRTRKADTQVEMDPSQALIIGGLINSNSANNLSKIPFIGDIPILGALARSKDFSKGDSELIIVIAPEIVRGARPSQILKPLAVEGAGRPGEFDYIPTNIDFSRTSTPINAPNAVPLRNTVDLSKPATVNDLDNIYH